MCTFAESQVTCLWWTLGGHTVILMTDSRGQERVRNDTATANKGLGRWDLMNRAEVQLYLNIKYMREALKPCTSLWEWEHRWEVIQCLILLPYCFKPYFPHPSHSWHPDIQFQCSRRHGGSSPRGSGFRGHRAPSCTSDASPSYRSCWHPERSEAPPIAAGLCCVRLRRGPARNPQSLAWGGRSTPLAGEEDRRCPPADPPDTFHHRDRGSHCPRWWRRACYGR